jgi:hypothetical protein
VTVSASLDVALGLAFVFLLFALAVSKINETIATALNLRHQGLKKALEALVGTGSGADGLKLSAENVLNHSLVKPLQAVIAPSRFLRPLLGGREKGISYLPARTFSATVLDLLAPVGQPDPKTVLDGIAAAGLPEPAQLALTAAQANPDLPNVQTLAGLLTAGDEKTKVQQLVVELRNDPLERATAAIAELGNNNPARQPLMRMLADAQGDRDRFRQSLEHWYDDTMDRVSGWYKRYVQRIIVIASIVLVAALNVDTINIAQVLWRLPTERAVVASAAAGQATAGDKGGRSADQQVRDIAALDLPLGWTPPHKGTVASTDPQHAPLTVSSWLLKVLGLLLSVMAVSLGAPFWFDALSKLGQLRATGPKPAQSAPPAS